MILIGGSGTGETHIAIGLARSCIRAGRKARCFNIVDLVNGLEAEVKLGRQGPPPMRSPASTSSS